MALVARCEAMEWGYEVGCWVDYAGPINGGKIALHRACRAEVTAANGMTITVDDMRTGREALAEAVGGMDMETMVARQATAGRSG